MKIVKESRMDEITEYRHEYVWEDDCNCGFSFPCDQSGNLLKTNDALMKNLEKCKTDSRIKYLGIKKFKWMSREASEGECCCGRIVVLWGNTNECDCGRLYNWAGQELKKDKSSWGEETGEHWSDVCSI